MSEEADRLRAQLKRVGVDLALVQREAQRLGTELYYGGWGVPICRYKLALHWLRESVGLSPRWSSWLARLFSPTGYRAAIELSRLRGRHGSAHQYGNPRDYREERALLLAQEDQP